MMKFSESFCDVLLDVCCVGGLENPIRMRKNGFYLDIEELPIYVNKEWNMI